MKVDESLAYVDDWLSDECFDDSIIRQLKASSSKLGISVYHCARKSPNYVGQHFEIEFKEDVYKVTFASQIKPTIKALLGGK